MKPILKVAGLHFPIGKRVFTALIGNGSFSLCLVLLCITSKICGQDVNENEQAAYRVKVGTVTFTISSVDTFRKSESATLYTPAWATSTKTGNYGLEILIEDIPALPSNGTLTGNVVRVRMATDSPIPINGIVISYEGSDAFSLFDQLESGLSAHVEAVGDGSSDKLEIVTQELYNFTPEAGWHEGAAALLIKPGHLYEGLTWLKTNGYNPVRNTYDYGQARNLYHIDVAIGSEHEIEKKMMAHHWVLSCKRYPNPAGPGDLCVEIPSRGLFNNSADQNALRKKLYDVLNSKFNGLITPSSLSVHRRGLSYKLQIEIPVERLNEEYAGYWLKTTIYFEFTRQGFDSKDLRDRINIWINDGFLARWDRSDIPPEGHYNHLSPGGNGKFRNFIILKWLTTEVAQLLASTWDGEIVSGFE